ncbi:uncharacterized protein [Gossypium hirsutum]|uniref:Uncharacterized protein n=1 Tax=Gossypium hirsutum TaxID=3635 RepID=A0A1U8P897_GOSHI|nr:uncharacterized protein LOC107956215 [Gossypium hirsutum]
MSSVSQKQHENFFPVKEIIKNLEELLKSQVTLARQSTITNLMKSQQKIDTPVKGHMLKLVGSFVEVQDNEAELGMNTQIEIVFKSLTNEFVGFRAAYNLRKKMLTLTQLMNELQSYELMLNGGKLVQEKPETNLAVSPSSSKEK